MKNHDEDAISLFGDSDISVVKSDTADYNKIRCHWVKYVETTFEEPLSVFDGYQSIKVISFSYNFGFIARLTERFEYAQIILGADFVASRMNQTVANQIEDVMATADELKLNLHRNKKLAKRIAENEIEVRYPPGLIDHRKLYLLKADDGRTRVIMPSANVSSDAWTGFNQIENFVLSDDPATYDAYIEEFETAWELSEPIVPNARVVDEVSDKQMDDLPERDIAGTESEQYSVKDENPILENAQKGYVDKAVIIRETDDPETKISIIEHNKDLEKLKEFHSSIIKEMKISTKKDKFYLVPSIIKKYVFIANKMSMKKVTIEKKSLGYPRMVVDYAAGCVLLDDIKLDLNPSDEEVKNDVKELLAVFSNFDNFVGRLNQAKVNHFKLMNAMFSSIFNAKLRCEANLRDIDTSGLPLYILLNSRANCGKTFMVEYFLKMMTGKKRFGYNFRNVKSAELEAFQSNDKVLHKGVPIFIDEISTAFKIAFGNMIRTVDSCENEFREFQPLTVFASNVVSDPDESLRKRMVFLTYDIGLHSNVIPRELKNNGKQLINRVGTALYRKYLSYMVPYVTGELNKIETGDGLTDKYSPELMTKSSEIILQIIKDSGFVVPDFMKVLSWDADYADNSQSVFAEELEKIADLYKTDKKLFSVDDKYVTITMSNDRIGNKYVSNWVSLLPREIQAEKMPDANYAKIRMNRKELEQHIGFQFDVGIRAKIKKMFL